MLFSLSFVKNAVVHILFFFFLFIYLYFLIIATIAQIFNPIVKLVLLTEILKEAKAEIETHPVIAETKISVQYNLESYKHFYAYYLSIHFSLFFWVCVFYIFQRYLESIIKINFLF